MGSSDSEMRETAIFTRREQYLNALLAPTVPTELARECGFQFKSLAVDLQGALGEGATARSSHFR